MKYTVESVIKEHDQGSRLEYIFFWGHTERKAGEISKACLSQWYPTRFFENGIMYSSAEQYMMAEKAKLFGDFVTQEKILQETDPQMCKALGRKVKGFSEKIWERNRYDIVKKANYAKFSHNAFIRQYLLSTGDKILVEASPYDGIWGIKMSQSDVNIKNPKFWKGKNLLGFALMEVRDLLR